MRSRSSAPSPLALRVTEASSGLPMRLSALARSSTPFTSFLTEMSVSHFAISFSSRAYSVKGLFISLRTTLRLSSVFLCFMESQISSQVKARMGANILVRVSRIKNRAVCAERRLRPSFSSQYSLSLMMSR